MGGAEWGAKLRHPPARGGADVNAVNKGKDTPLHWAASKRDNERIWLLAEHGADLDIQDGKGRTALHLATSKGRVEVAEALIVLGASTGIKNRKENAAGGGPHGLRLSQTEHG